MFSFIIDTYNFQKKTFHLEICKCLFFNDIGNCFFDGHKVIHHSHITREIYEYVRNFCNKKVREIMDRNGTVREVTDNNGHHFTSVFHNSFSYGKLRTFLYWVVVLLI